MAADADAPPGDRPLYGRMMTSISAGHTFGNRVRMLDLVRRKPRSPRQDPLTAASAARLDGLVFWKSTRGRAAEFGPGALVVR